MQVSTYTAVAGSKPGLARCRKVLNHPGSSLDILVETENLLRKNMIEYKHVALRYTEKDI